MAILAKNTASPPVGYPTNCPTAASTSNRVVLILSRALATWLLLSLAVSPLAGYSQTASRPETELKAAFIQKFPNYIDWPENAFEDDKAPLRIGVLDDKEIFKALKLLAVGKTFEQRKIIVVESKKIQDLLDCQIVFVNDMADADLRKCLKTIKEKPILTIGESPEFTRRGGIVRLYKKEKKLRIEINALAYKAADLKISSKLLGLATVVSHEVES